MLGFCFFFPRKTVVYLHQWRESMGKHSEQQRPGYLPSTMTLSPTDEQILNSTHRVFVLGEAIHLLPNELQSGEHSVPSASQGIPIPSCPLLCLSILFSIVAAPISITTSNIQGFPFFHILTNICYLLGFLIIIILTDVK